MGLCWRRVVSVGLWWRVYPGSVARDETAEGSSLRATPTIAVGRRPGPVALQLCICNWENKTLSTQFVLVHGRRPSVCVTSQGKVIWTQHIFLGNAPH